MKRLSTARMIFATGFAPFRGGPMHYARTRGIADVRDTLKRLAAAIRTALPARSGLGHPAMIHSDTGPQRFDDPERLADAIVEKVGKTIVLALPLGLGKANHIANALFAKAAADPSIRLTIFTALTLEPPHAKSELEHRFLDPIAQRVFAGYPPLAYAAAIRAGTGAAERRRSTNSSSRPGNGSARPTRSSITSRPITRTRCATCSTAASTWSRNSWRTAPARRRDLTA